MSVERNQESNRIAFREQANRLVHVYGFHEALGLTEKAYRESLPTFQAQPEKYQGRLALPLIVDRRVSLSEQHKRAGVREDITESEIRSIVGEAPKDPYAIWTHDGSRYLTTSVVEAQREFAKYDEQGADPYEITALYLHHPEIFKDHGVGASGSRRITDSGLVPYLMVGDEPRFSVLWDDNKHSDWGALSRGKEIVLKEF
jgi:hypothetical protein